jgi:hypothetical protein
MAGSMSAFGSGLLSIHFFETIQAAVDTGSLAPAALLDLMPSEPDSGCGE